MASLDRLPAVRQRFERGSSNRPAPRVQIATDTRNEDIRSAERCRLQAHVIGPRLFSPTVGADIDLERPAAGRLQSDSLSRRGRPRRQWHHFKTYALLTERRANLLRGIRPFVLAPTANTREPYGASGRA